MSGTLDAERMFAGGHQMLHWCDWGQRADTWCQEWRHGGQSARTDVRARQARRASVPLLHLSGDTDRPKGRTQREGVQKGLILGGVIGGQTIIFEAHP